MYIEKQEIIGIIGGSGFGDFEHPQTVFCNRHKMTQQYQGNKSYNVYEGIPPHKIDYHGIIKKLSDQKVRNIIGVCSVGSANPNIPVGTIVVPSDFVELGKPETIFNEKAVHVTPELDYDLRCALLDAANKVGISALCHSTYYKTIGPRFETPVEIRIIHNVFKCDIVGMTMPGEATIACEMGLKYAAICVVDNMCNGLTNKKLKAEDLKIFQKLNQDKIKMILNALF